MRAFLIILVFTCLFNSCKKSAEIEVTGTLMSQSGPVKGSLLFKVDKPGSKKYSFVCTNDRIVFPEVSCNTHIYIINLPNELKIPGIKIRFSRYSDKGKNLIFSSNVPPHDVEVYNALRIE